MKVITVIMLALSVAFTANAQNQNYSQNDGNSISNPGLGGHDFDRPGKAYGLGGHDFEFKQDKHAIALTSSQISQISTLLDEFETTLVQGIVDIKKEHFGLTASAEIDTYKAEMVGDILDILSTILSTEQMSAFMSHSGARSGEPTAILKMMHDTAMGARSGIIDTPGNDN